MSVYADWMFSADENRLITAQHETAHALAYINFGLDFEYIDVPQAYTAVAPRPIDRWSSAVVALAGQLVDMRVMMDRHGDAAGIGEWIAHWEDTVEFAVDDLPFGTEEPDDDIFRTGAYLSAALPFAYAFVDINWPLIAELGDIVHEQERTPYADFMQLLGDRRPASLAPEALATATALFAPFADRLDALSDDMRVLPLR